MNRRGRMTGDHRSRSSLVCGHHLHYATPAEVYRAPESRGARPASWALNETLENDKEEVLQKTGRGKWCWGIHSPCQISLETQNRRLTKPSFSARKS